jgi:glycine cleavage system aminomethyltransferase T
VPVLLDSMPAHPAARMPDVAIVAPLNGANTGVIVSQINQTAMRITGKTVAGGVTCPLFMTSDGKKIALAGLPADLAAPGLSLALEGQFVETSFCMQGAGTFQIQRATRL